MFILSLAIALSTSSLLARAQEASTSATCLAEFDWMKNSKGQTPCLISAWLNVPCQPQGLNIIGPLQDGTYYTGPREGSDLLQCQCNTVLYSTTAACAWCQGHTDNLGISNWTQFSVNCQSTMIGSYPQSLILLDTAIPAWAYAPLMGTPGRWDEKAAFAIAQQGLPESTHSATQTSTSASSTLDSTSSGSSGLTPSQSSQSVSGTPTADLSDSGPPKSRGVIGPAVGGTIGGIAILLLLGIGVWLYFRRRRGLPNKSGAVVTSSDRYESEGPHALSEKVVLYNPDDPSTYPSAQPWNRGIEGTTVKSMDTSDRTENTASRSGYMGRAEIQ
ncbi:hypothetical protein C8Q74DRAFT_35389 [Fomes fomentarius]|nr:hypothetical protein C8Q74DRAFT_35389 [Fomes fomentarius]